MAASNLRSKTTRILQEKTTNKSMKRKVGNPFQGARESMFSILDLCFMNNLKSRRISACNNDLPRKVGLAEPAIASVNVDVIAPQKSGIELSPVVNRARLEFPLSIFGLLQHNA